MTDDQLSEPPHSRITRRYRHYVRLVRARPVPVHLVNFSLYRGLCVCAECLAEEDIHVKESKPAVLFKNEVQEAA